MNVWGRMCDDDDDEGGGSMKYPSEVDLFGPQRKHIFNTGRLTLSTLL